MDAGRKQRHPQHSRTNNRVAAGRPEGSGDITFVSAAERLIDNGYEPLPIIPGEKRPAPSRWTSVDLNSACIDNWLGMYPGHGVGLRTGRLVGLDIDELDPDRAHAAQNLAERRFGQTLVRVGQWPKRLLLYRTDQPFQKLKAGQIEILGLGQQFVAFGRHQGTGRSYYWPAGETPLEVDINDMPLIDQENAAAFLAEMGPGSPVTPLLRRTRCPEQNRTADGPVRDVEGIVIDGRDAWLSRIAFHAVHDALESGATDQTEAIAERVWGRFSESTSLIRPRQDRNEPYAPTDAFKKVRDKMKLAREGRLQSRETVVPEPDYAVPTLSVGDARVELSELVAGFCAQVQAWHGKAVDHLPSLGIRATVGIGKSRIAREQFLSLATSLQAKNLPYHILVFTASHTLAEETAHAWRAEGAQVAVLRGYERKDPVTGEPMCRDLDTVRVALSASLRVRRAACCGLNGVRCEFFNTCPKQQNLRDVAAADVVIAPYDALFSGLALERDDVALLLIDEGCWARAIERKNGIYVEDILSEWITGMGTDRIGCGPVGAMADLMAFRCKVARACTANGPGPMSRQSLRDVGLTAEACQQASGVERWRLKDPGLVPGVEGVARHSAIHAAADNARIIVLASLWEAMGQFLNRGGTLSGQVRIKKADTTGRHEIVLRRVRGLHESLRNKPVLHLDATMRTELVRTILPALVIKQIDVAAPHMHVRCVRGSFGKSMLCSDAGLTPDEATRRTNRLQECVDYVRWHARRLSPRRVLVVTYQSIEAAFAGIPNVETAHFNAVAGLDIYKDVRLLISIGRPLPPSYELEALTGAYFDCVPKGQYRRSRGSIRMASGLVRGLDVLRHGDELTETLRAAICDDELIQVIGRGRGVNRSVKDPLEVHVLSDVALPVICNRLMAWEHECPDVLQQMLLAGIAVDSPTDAVALHPDQFQNAEQAKKVFGRGAFKGQNPIINSYREMSLKSASYRRAGRGRGWQRALWIEGDDAMVRRFLEDALGKLACWRPDILFE